MKKSIALIALLGMITSHAVAAVATFDSKNTGPNNYYRPTTDGNYDWTDNGMTFNMNVSWSGGAWDGFTYSDVNDTTTSGYLNQYAVYGDGLDRSDTGVYAVSYAGATPTVSFASAQTVNGFWANNTTYAALAILNGEGSATAFTTGDWFKMTIEGFDSNSATQGVVDFYLADFRTYTVGDTKEDYMTTDWSYVDLSSLGDNVSSLQFSMSSTDNGTWGMNTPAYFAMDDMQTVPEPASALLGILGGLSIFVYRRAKTKQAEAEAA